MVAFLGFYRGNFEKVSYCTHEPGLSPSGELRRLKRSRTDADIGLQIYLIARKVCLSVLQILHDVIVL